MLTGGKSFVSSPPAFSNDAKRLLVCTGSTVSIFSTSTGLQICELEGHESQVTSVIVVPAPNPGSLVLCYCWTASLDGKIKYWDFAAPELMKTIDIRLPIHSMVIPSLLSQTTESNGKAPNLFAYVHTENVKQEGQPNSLGSQIQKCYLTKSRLVGGVTLAETRKPGPITVSPSGKFIGIYEKRKLCIWEIPEKDHEHVGFKKIRLHHTKAFTAMAFHPTERVVAAGDVTGRISIWRGVGRETCLNSKLSNGRLNKDSEGRPGVRDEDDADSCTTWHWHSAQVNVLFFSSDGAYLYSGGREGVLVVWQLNTGKKKFLPRIGSRLLYFINSPDPTLSSISRADNQIQLLQMPSMQILRSISGIKLPSSHMDVYEGFGSSVVFNPTAGLIAVPAENYCVQIYSLFDDREISEVQICERNHQPGDEITVKVNLVALSQDASTMSTVETRLPEEGIGSLVTLKFWACGSQKKSFSLLTVIYEPHRDAGVSCIAFRPTGHMAVSSSYGGDFKVWVHEHVCTSKDENIQSTGWTCHAVGSYKKKPMTAAAFSNDGSVLAVAADKVITLWDPDRNNLLAVIGDSLEPITNLTFVGKSDYLVSASRGSNPHLTVWSMSKLSTIWSYRLDTEAIACSMDSSTFAVLALYKRNESVDAMLQSAEGVILLFDAEKAVPLSAWSVSKAQGGGLSFVQSSPYSENGVAETEVTDEVLAYVNGGHEYVLFNPHGERANKISISRQRDFRNLEETDKHGYASVYGELPELSLKIDRTRGALQISAETLQKMAAEMALVKPISKFNRSIPRFGSSKCPTTRFFTVRMSTTTPPPPTAAGKKKIQKQDIKESLLTPRFYTTDFDEMEQLFNTEINKNLNMGEFDALLQEFKTDFNQTHFVRNKEFKEAADKIQGPLRQIFVEFLERSCTAEFSGFLLYKELGRRLKKTNPVVAEIFSLMSRDEARHAGFLNKGLSDFNLALDLGFLTKARKYTFFKPKFIFYATYLSEKIGYWRYITIYRHLKQNPEYQCYPIFKYFENWCQDENRHGDFFSALMKAQPQFLNDWKAKLWSRFFCLSVYVTMYLNDCQRTDFYEGIGLDTKEFDMHVIIETNRTTARIFPAVLDVENPEFKRKLDRMVEINTQILAIGESDNIAFVKNLKRIPLIAALASELLAAYLMKPIESGSVDLAEFEPQLVY